MIQPSECLHDRLDHGGRCGDCGTLIFVNVSRRYDWGAVLKQVREEPDVPLQDPEAGYGYAYGKGWKGPPPNPQKGR